jgi:Zn-dependent protease with chaperone function
MFELLGITLFLAGLLTINSLAAFLVDALCRFTNRWRQRWSNQIHARLLFIARILPFTISLSLLLLLLAPAYIVYEPRHYTEEISFKLVLLAVVSAAGILLTVWRGVSSWRATRRLTRNWLAAAHSISVPGVSIPAYRFQHAFPVIAVVGSIRPRLFIADQVLTALSPSELTAAIAHEKAHLEARDNLKRGLLRACRDMLGIVPCGRSLDRAWAAASEVAADELASSKGSGVALDLAAALVKIARLVPQGTTLRVPAGAFLIDGSDMKGISSRVGKLLQLAAAGCQTRLGFRAARAAIPATLITVFSVLIFGGTSTSLLETAHSFTEQFVSLLK